MNTYQMGKLKIFQQCRGEEMRQIKSEAKIEEQTNTEQLTIYAFIHCHESKVQ